MTRRRLLRYAGIAAAAFVVMGAAGAAFLSLQTVYQPPTGGTPSLPCSPKPCANVQGYTLWVTDLKIEGGLVQMQLTFRNSSSSTHADPADIQLLDSQKHSSSPVYDAPGCTQWARTDFNDGARFGPVHECFRPAVTDAPLSIHWTPDMGFFCCDTVIALEPPNP
jgi:hypothetical protein